MWTYTDAPSTTSTAGLRDAVRLLVKDNSTARGKLLSDEEIAFFLTAGGQNPWRAAAEACRGLAAREARAKRVGDLSIEGLGESYLKLASMYESRADLQAVPFAGGISQLDKDLRAGDTDRVAPAFSREMLQPVRQPSLGPDLGTGTGIFGP